jgi:filamentous hemagglutinin
VKLPKGFANEEGFKGFVGKLQAGLEKAGHTGVQPLFQGSSATGESFRKKVPFDQGRTSDYDIALASPELFARAIEIGVKTRGKGTRTGPLKPKEMRRLGPNKIQRELSRAAGRPVKFMLYNDAKTAAERTPSIPTSP